MLLCFYLSLAWFHNCWMHEWFFVKPNCWRMIMFLLLTWINRWAMIIFSNNWPLVFDGCCVSLLENWDYLGGFPYHGKVEKYNALKMCLFDNVWPCAWQWKHWIIGLRDTYFSQYILTSSMNLIWFASASVIPSANVVFGGSIFQRNEGPDI